MSEDIEILIVEDSPVQAAYLQRILEQHSYHVSVARNGVEALASMKKREPSIVISDIIMPEMDGYELCQCIRADENLKHIPVILLTQLSDPKDVIRGLECGANNFVTKPYSEEFLLSRIQYVFMNKELRKSAVTEEGIEIFFADQRYSITSDRIQILDLLLSTYEAAVEKNQELERANEELEKALETIRTLKQRLEAVLDSTRDAIAMFDVKGHLLLANRWYGEIFGLTDEALKEMSADELRQRIKECFQEPDLFEEAEASFFANPEDVLEEIVEVKLPERRMLYQFMAPVHDAGENIIGRITVYRDVSKELEIDQMKAEVLRLRAELEMEYSFDNIIGKSRKMRGIYALMQQAIQSDITVLIQGESGTGKELVAKSIHFNSSRKTGTFVAVNCVAIPETLIESELFGHERGAFTGATTRRIGKFEQANGGTILLDEIGEMHPSLQARLLRVLQEREIQRVGGTNTIPVDVRVIASTNKDLGAAMEAGEFREDLFYRVAAFPIVIPPIREHREDIPLLAEHFLGLAAEKAGKSITVISTEASQLLMSYDWPGNVRELENVIERAALLETSGVLQASSLPPEIHLARKQPHIPASQDSIPDTTEISPLEEVEKQALVHALKVTGNNIRQAAKALGINRATVYRKLKKHNLLEKK